MRSIITLFSLLVISASSIVASPTPQECQAEYCPALDRRAITPIRAARSLMGTLTNAQRFARGLPPKRPKLAEGGTPVRVPRAGSSPVPLVTYRGYIQVSDSGNNNVLGYMSGTSGYLTSIVAAVADATVVDFKLPVGVTSGTQLDALIENSPYSGGYTYLGLVQGRDSTTPVISSGSFNYLYVTATSQTSPGSTPQQVGNAYNSYSGNDHSSESAVWSLDVTTNALSVQWINPDGSSPATGTWTQSNYNYAGGDQNAFYNRYPAPVTGLTYKFIPI